MTHASKLISASLATFMLGASITSASKSPNLPPITKLATDFGRNAPTFKTADIGGWFNDLSSKYTNNYTIQNIDQKFQNLLSDLFKNGDEKFNNTIYGSYGDDMEFIASGYYDPDAQGKTDLQIDICTSTDMHSFYKRYLDKIETYLRDNPHIAAQLKNAPKIIKDLRKDIAGLKTINDREALNLELEGDLKSSKFPCGLRTVSAPHSKPKGFG